MKQLQVLWISWSILDALTLSWRKSGIKKKFTLHVCYLSRAGLGGFYMPHQDALTLVYSLHSSSCAGMQRDISIIARDGKHMSTAQSTWTDIA